MLPEIPVSSANDLTLSEAVRRVVAQNESLQMQLLDTEIKRHAYLAEKGIFEPQVTGSYEHDGNDRQNNMEQQLSLLGAPILREQNNIYSGGLEFLSPIGTQLKLGYTLQDLRNNLGSQLGGGGIERWIHQYQSFAGGSLIQPLLKNFGATATLARLRLAALGSDLAFQDYRRQLMLIVTRAEAAYWDLYLTEQQERISQESVKVAEFLFKDATARLKLGKASELDVLQARSGLSSRQARWAEARAKRIDGLAQLANLMSGTLASTNLNFRAVDSPHPAPPQESYFQNFQAAFTLNPDYLSRKTQVEQENIRLAYAKNQRWPELDLKGSYGLNGLGDTPAGSMQFIERGDFTTWTAGLELRIPVLGGVRERHELAAAQLSKKKALIGLKEIEIQISNAIEQSIQKLKSAWDDIQNNVGVADFNQKLLNSQLARWNVGKMDTQLLLETEEKLFEARVNLLDSEVQFEKDRLESELVSGLALKDRNLDLTKRQLEERTQRLLRGRKWSDRELAKAQEDLVRQYQASIPPLHPTPENMADWELRQEMERRQRARDNLEDAQHDAQQSLEDFLSQPAGASRAPGVNPVLH